MKAREDAPDDLLHAFRVDAATGLVRWATVEELERAPLRRADRKHGRLLPFGQPAGSKRVLGHGHLVMYAGRQLLTMDIAQGLTWLAPELAFTWNRGVPSETGDASPTDDVTTLLIHRTWALTGDVLTWRISPHSTLPAGSPARGVILGGRGDAALSYQGTVYVSSDVRHTLEHGALPWAAAIEWD